MIGATAIYAAYAETNDSAGSADIRQVKEVDIVRIFITCGRVRYAWLNTNNNRKAYQKIELTNNNSYTSFITWNLTVTLNPQGKLLQKSNK